MVQGCFWDNRRSDLYILDRDFTSKKYGYSANSYLEVLDGQVSPWYRDLDDKGYVFMQDNAPIYTAHKVRDWFVRNGVYLTPWPPYSPDLNPIEYIQQELKKKVVELFLEVAADTSKSEEARARLESALQASWDMIDKEVFDNLYESMEHRIRACILAKGQHTSY